MACPRTRPTPPPHPPGDGARGPAPGSPFALGEALADAGTGTPLVALLESLDADALSSFDLVEVVHAAGRMAAWAHAVQARYAAALAARPQMQPPPARVSAGRPLTAVSVAGQSLSMRLLRSPARMEALVRDGVAFAGVLADTGEALAAGHIDVPRAQAITSRLHEQHWRVAADVQARVLPRAADSTAGQVRRDVERALLEVDPEHATERHRAARARRCVTRPRTEADGMASFLVRLPAVDAVQVDSALEASARTARSAGDPRTLDQLRADGLVAAVTRAVPADAGLTTGPAEDGTAAAPGSGAVHPRAQIHVTVALSTLLGLDDRPADLAGYGPLDAVQARALALGGTWQRIVTDGPSGSVLDVGRTRYRPPAALADHVRHRDRTCTGPGCLVPAHLADLDHTRDYRPPPGDPDPPGTTSHHNLGPACRRHHRHKTETGLRLEQHAPGQFDWTDPTGHRYRTHPGTDGPTEHLTAPGRRGPGEDGGEPPGTAPAADPVEDDPPF